MDGGTLSTPTALNAATFYYGCFPRSGSASFQIARCISAAIAVLNGYFYLAIFDVEASTTIFVKSQYSYNPISSVCYSCSIGDTGYNDGVILIGGSGGTAPKIWAFNESGSRIFSVTIACSSKALTSFVISTIAGDVSGTLNTLVTNYNIAAIGIDQSSKSQFFLLRSFETIEATWFLKHFVAGAAISKVRVQVSARMNGYTDAFYYVETLSSKVLYRIHANGLSN